MSQSQNAAAIDLGAAAPATPLRPVSGPNSGFEHHSKDRSGPASVPPSTAARRERPGVKKSGRRGLWIGLAVAFSVIAAGLAWHMKQEPKVASLPQPVDVGTVVPVPDTGKQALPSPISATVDAASAASASADAAKPVLQTTLADIVEKIGSLGDTLQNLVKGHEDLDGRVVELESEMSQLKQQIAQASAQRRAVPRPRVTAPRPAIQPRPIQSTGDEAASRLLSVDLWDGKPSVAVGRNRSGTNEVRFLTEGDSNGQAVVKKADVGQQRAVIATDKGDYEISRDQQ